ncbi:MAG TPA: type III-B CRISPR-associated protein Cas10/Cmr2 [Pseudobacteroides sp.]|nr:type III-B CRISPR-associated protein Cas10/Cmr2 [Pseudobacteroides sp.]
MREELFIFTITPVQSFISSVRKTQDFYAGSYLLSHLCKVALKTAADNGFKVVFPEENQKGIPNRFVCKLDISDEEKMKISKEIENSVANELEHIGKTIARKVGITVPEEFYIQLNNYFKVYWVFTEIAEDYRYSHNSLIKRLSDIKTTRTFIQINEKGRKCSLFPEYNALVGYERRPFMSDKAVYLSKEFIESNPVYMEKGECLSALGFVKRFLNFYFINNYENEFFSTSKIAALSGINNLLKLDKSIEKEIRNLGNDFGLVYDLKNKIEINNKIFSDSKKKSAYKIYNSLSNNKISISPYYAIIKFDGDNMGKIYSNPDLKVNDKVSVIDFQKKLSKDLCNFADYVKEKIDNSYTGKVVYAGGEDFMGFLTLDCALGELNYLRNKFENIESSKLLNKRLTFSAGIVIVHYKTPLSEAIKMVESMEKEAKKIDKGKDAFGIALLKHSGEIIKGKLKFKDFKGGNMLDIIESLIDKLSKYEISKSFIYKINQEFGLIALENEDVSEYFDEMVINRIKVYLNNSEKKITSSELDEISACLKNIYYAKGGNKKEFFDILSIITFLSRERGEKYAVKN